MRSAYRLSPIRFGLADGIAIILAAAVAAAAGVHATPLRVHCGATLHESSPSGPPLHDAEDVAAIIADMRLHD